MRASHLSHNGFRRTNRFFFVKGVISAFPLISSPIVPLDFDSSSTFLAALALAAISNGILVLMLIPAGGVEVA